MTRGGKLFWSGYLAWIALVAASAAGLLPWRWYVVLAAPFVVAVGGLFLWIAGMAVLTLHYRVLAFFAHQRRPRR